MLTLARWMMGPPPNPRKRTARGIRLERPEDSLPMWRGDRASGSKPLAGTQRPAASGVSAISCDRARRSSEHVTIQSGRLAGASGGPS
jgi:hypothetical protein